MQSAVFVPALLSAAVRREGLRGGFQGAQGVAGVAAGDVGEKIQGVRVGVDVQQSDAALLVRKGAFQQMRVWPHRKAARSGTGANGTAGAR